MVEKTKEFTLRVGAGLIKHAGIRGRITRHNATVKKAQRIIMETDISQSRMNTAVNAQPLGRRTRGMNAVQPMPKNLPQTGLAQPKITKSILNELTKKGAKSEDIFHKGVNKTEFNALVKHAKEGRLNINYGRGEIIYVTFNAKE